MVMAALGQPLAQAVQPVQWVWSAKWGQGPFLCLDRRLLRCMGPVLQGAAQIVQGQLPLPAERSPTAAQSMGAVRSAGISLADDPLPSPRRLNRLKVRELSGAAISAGATAVKKGFWNWTENTVPWKELVHT